MGSTRALSLAVGLLALAPASTLAAQDGGIEVFAAEPLFDRGTRVSFSSLRRERTDLVRGSREVFDPLDREAVEARSVVGVDHGIAYGRMVSILVPYVSNEASSTAGTTRAEGAGDVAVLAKMLLKKADWRRSAYHVAWIAGLELPTGETGARSGGQRVAPSLQPGSGSWDPIGALTANLNLDRYRFDALLLRKWNREGAQDFQAGDRAIAEASAAYRFLQRPYPGPTASARIGLRWTHVANARSSGSLVPNSGGTTWELRTGLTWHPAPRWDVTLGYDVPLDERLAGAQLGSDHRLVFAIGVRF